MGMHPFTGLRQRSKLPPANASSATAVRAASGDPTIASAGMKTSLTVIGFSLAGLFGAPALAGKCGPLAPAQVVAEAETIFVGKVLLVTGADYSPGPACSKSNGANPQCGGKVVTFQVVQNLKGIAAPQVGVLAEDGCYCFGGYFAKGEEHLVVANRNPTTHPAQLLAKNLCGGTGPAKAD